MTQSERQLACGTRSTDLIEQVAEGDAEVRTPHQTTCPFCQETLGKLEHTWQAVGHFRSQDVVPPPRLLKGVMDRVRAGLDDWSVEVRRERGTTRISRRVLVMLAYEVASGVAGVGAVGLVRPRRPAGPRTERVDIELELAITFGSSAPRVSELVRDEVIARFREHTGLEVGTVQVSVTDVSAD